MSVKNSLIVLGAIIGIAVGVTAALSLRTTVDVSFVGDVDESWAIKARDLDRMLNSMPRVSKVNMYINSYGGTVDEMNVVLGVMDRQKAKGIVFDCSVDNKAMSAGAQMLVNCNNVILTPRSSILFHVGGKLTPKGYRKLNEIDDKYEFKRLRNDFKVLQPILTAEEYNDVLNGVDVIVSGAEINERLEKSAKGHKQ